MKTVNSISGGRTSAYMAWHYPADHEVFAVVLIGDKNCTPSDKGLVKIVSDKLGRDFIATAESDLTLRVVLNLEQKTGRNIDWVAGKTFESVNKSKSAIPNQQWRFCTTEMKMRPIWDWWLANIGEKIRMGIGFRYDEIERAERLTTSFKGIVGKQKTGGRNKWEEIEWREGYFPLIENRITHYPVKQWADKSGLVFPEDSNCVGCFHKSPQQLRVNFDNEPIKMQWFEDQERKSTWKKEISYKEIRNIWVQKGFNFGEGAGCNGGFCTD